MMTRCTKSEKEGAARPYPGGALFSLTESVARN